MMILFKPFLQSSSGRLTRHCLHRLEDIYGCPYDFIEVFDGRRVASLSMGRFCAGTELTFLSSSNIMTVVFRSDAMITNTGFYTQYNAIQQDGSKPGRYLINTCLGGASIEFVSFPLKREHAF